MKFIISVCVLFCSVAWNPTSAAALGERTSYSLMSPSWVQQRTIRATGNGAQAGNMTVAFVPLISIIANLLPRFFNRYGTALPTNVGQARLFPGEQNPEMECQELSHVGMKWPKEANSSYYYQCFLLEKCSSLNTNFCFAKKLQKCKHHTMFDFDKQLCSSVTSGFRLH